MSLKKKRVIGVALLLLCGFIYSYFGYFFERENFIELILGYGILVISFLFCLTSETFTHRQLFGIGLFFRVLFFSSVPFLSQDVYRFIWDGYCCLHGVNPYTISPDTIMQQAQLVFPNQAYLVEKMGELSASNFSNYPPFKQLLFSVTAFMSGGSIMLNIIFIRLLIILADIGFYIGAIRLLKHFNLKSSLVFMYLLNPLVILELSGNLHFEGIMLCFFIWGLYGLVQNKMLQSGFAYSISILTKLIPLLFIFMLIRTLSWRKWLIFCSITAGFCLLAFMPFINLSSPLDFLETTALWFTNFEFNGSIYYVMRFIGNASLGYNPIAIVGRGIMVFLVLLIVVLSFNKKNSSILGTIRNMLLLLSIYFFISTTVHPWYIITLLGIGIFTKFRFVFLWSFTIMISYIFYSFEEANSLFLFLEYLPVFALFIIEIISPNRKLFFDFSPKLLEN